MGLAGMVSRVPAAELEAALADAIVERRSLLGRTRRSFDLEAFDAALWADDPPPFADLDKAWEAVHFTLTGTRDPVDRPEGFLLGGEEVLPDGAPMDEFIGIHRHDAVRAIAAALEPLDVPAFDARIDLAALNRANVYPAAIWGREDEADINREYVRESYASLRALVLEAAANGDCLYVAIG